MPPRVNRFVKTTAFRRGVMGASRGWLGIWLGMTLVRRFRKLLQGNDEKVLERVELKPGDVLEIRDTGIIRKDFPKNG